MSRVGRRQLLALIIVASAVLAFGAEAQGPNGYPNAERVIGLAGGDSITLLNRFVHDNSPAMRLPGRRLDLQYATRIPASDSLGRLEQADRAAHFFGRQAIELGVRRLSIGICDTRACAERRDPPRSWYLYERAADGWRRVK